MANFVTLLPHTEMKTFIFTTITIVSVQSRSTYLGITFMDFRLATSIVHIAIVSTTLCGTLEIKETMIMKMNCYRKYHAGLVRWDKVSESIISG